MDDRADGLTLKIALGVAGGILLAAFVLGLLVMLQQRYAEQQAAQALERAMQDMKRATRAPDPLSVPRTVAPTRPAAPPAVASPSCRAGEVQGLVNGKPVCVGRSSGITRPLGE